MNEQNRKIACDAARMAYRAGREEQQRLLENKLCRRFSSTTQAELLRTFYHDLPGEPIDIMRFVRDAESLEAHEIRLNQSDNSLNIEDIKPAIQSLAAYASHDPSKIDFVFSDKTKCPMCEMAKTLAETQGRHQRYSKDIRDAIGADRKTRPTGEPSHSDAFEIRMLKAKVQVRKDPIRNHASAEGQDTARCPWHCIHGVQCTQETGHCGTHTRRDCMCEHECGCGNAGHEPASEVQRNILDHLADLHAWLACMIQATKHFNSLPSTEAV